MQGRYVNLSFQNAHLISVKPMLALGYVVAQLVEALRYELEGHGFDS